MDSNFPANTMATIRGISNTTRLVNVQWLVRGIRGCKCIRIRPSKRRSLESGTSDGTKDIVGGIKFDGNREVCTELHPSHTKIQGVLPEDTLASWLKPSRIKFVGTHINKVLGRLPSFQLFHSNQLSDIVAGHWWPPMKSKYLKPHTLREGPYLIINPLKEKQL